MPPIIITPPATAESMIAHSWLADDQKAAFGATPFAAGLVSLSSYLSPWLTSTGYTEAAVRKEIYIQDAQVTQGLMNQALEFLQRALCNTIGHYILAQNGLETWARVTNYYASYFCVHSLLCLQGRTITRLHLDKALTVHIIPIDFRSHIYGITPRHLGSNPHHEAPWKRFYEIYDRYAVSHQAYELVSRFAFISDPTDESFERNTINYTPFKGFAEIRDLARRQEFSTLFADYISDLKQKSTLEEFLIDLQGFASDPEHKYFARVLLKLALAGDIIHLVRTTSPGLENEWMTMKQRWLDFLTTIFPDQNDCYLHKFVPLIGSTPN